MLFSLFASAVVLIVVTTAAAFVTAVCGLPTYGLSSCLCADAFGYESTTSAFSLSLLTCRLSAAGIEIATLFKIGGKNIETLGAHARHSFCTNL